MWVIGCPSLRPPQCLGTAAFACPPALPLRGVRRTILPLAPYAIEVLNPGIRCCAAGSRQGGIALGFGLASSAFALPVAELCGSTVAVLRQACLLPRRGLSAGARPLYRNAPPRREIALLRAWKVTLAAGFGHGWWT